MKRFYEQVKTFMQDEEGLSVVEYVVGAALLVGALSAVFTTLGPGRDRTLLTNMI
ncbi:Flp family type IVb pilin [Vibrio aestuarianus]|uniref:Flp family type IVb pilin n=1 Tax=Vibrio aestuarianus TaxID=28171 RepID=UPI00237CC168|nr:Flp family type IVb pilin [Vibrio aestuarianus]MDE1272520.1 Flp family type IVb pilin [Vibrio aestuarianus]MDE1293852.1 Flp family type IVb pilin [Vibrio aestuarianus]MDE1308146.1 Flp family type IVb pilin [Vibrio aestuarianus]MDH5892645.1 Flp family type IVb pilin [Vibrio aestuarianus]MDH5909179.1 Flp family type IVb pilin [Vibrio aestuarianus]